MKKACYISARTRKNFGRIELVASMPNLIEVQKNSYEKHFLQVGIEYEKGKIGGFNLS
jgi:DNA-directed RNA polymerase subunit beta